MFNIKLKKDDKINDIITDSIHFRYEINYLILL
jgi:hypothetical protein